MLLSSLAAGDKQAFAQIFELYWDRVYGAALRLTKSPDLARDLGQDIFLKLWDNREKLAGVKNFPSFLYAITRNLVFDHLRKKVFRESNREFLLHYFARTEAPALEALESRELDQLLYAAIDRLPPKLKQVLRLARFEGLSHEEIASRLGITPQSSKTYMVRALAALNKDLTSHAEKMALLFFVLMFSFS